MRFPFTYCSAQHGEEVACLSELFLLHVGCVREKVCPIELFPIGYYLLSSDRLN